MTNEMMTNEIINEIRNNFPYQSKINFFRTVKFHFRPGSCNLDTRKKLKYSFDLTFLVSNIHFHTFICIIS